MSKKVLETADKVDVKLDEQLNKIPVVGKQIAAATSGVLLIAILAFVLGAVIF